MSIGSWTQKWSTRGHVTVHPCVYNANSCCSSAPRNQYYIKMVEHAIWNHFNRIWQLNWVAGVYGQLYIEGAISESEHRNHVTGTIRASAALIHVVARPLGTSIIREWGNRLSRETWIDRCILLEYRVHVGNCTWAIRREQRSRGCLNLTDAPRCPSVISMQE